MPAPEFNFVHLAYSVEQETPTRLNDFVVAQQQICSENRIRRKYITNCYLSFQNYLADVFNL